MSEDQIFLAIRPPKGELSYYRSVSASSLYFHFSNWEQDQQLKIAVERIGDHELEKDFAFYKKPSQPSVKYEDQIKLYQAAINEMKKGDLNKVVLSRNENLRFDQSPFVLFNSLAAAYPNAAVYIFSHPEVGTWLGASPETLVSWTSSEIVIDSLAGTKTWSQRTSFTEKEYDEQAQVSEEIEALLKNTEGLVQVKKQGPQILKAGNLAHLHSEYRAAISARFDFKNFLKKLHPTPAVGGRPRKKALEFIASNELYRRRFYTGFFGFESSEAGQFWVNLRCAELCEDNILSLYLGGGLTHKSDPQSEWQETEAKAGTILNVLKS